jgi:hypothetical protein
MIKKDRIKNETLLLFCILHLCIQVSGCSNGFEKLKRYGTTDEVGHTDPIPQSVSETKEAMQGKPQIGNTYGNIMNYGLVVQTGNWVYYTNSSDEWKIYKKRIDGSENTKISDYAGWDLNVIDDWIYYTDMTEGEAGILMRTSIVDKKDEVLTNNYAINVIATKDWVYYLDGYWLYKTTPDWSETVPLIKQDQMVFHFLLYDDLIVYSAQDDNTNRGLFKINTDGANKEKIYDGEVRIVHVDNNWIYIKLFSDEHSLYKISWDGSKLEKLFDITFSYINIHDDWIYYSNKDGIYKISLNGEHNIKLTDDPGMNINVIDGWIYYRHSTVLKRVKMDGTEIQVFD